jgi:hypothetical protein
MECHPRLQRSLPRNKAPGLVPQMPPSRGIAVGPAIRGESLQYESTHSDGGDFH